MDCSPDDAVAATNDDAALCKYQAVTKGYYRDPFLEHFIPAKMRNSTVRKAPEINRGYYARSASISYLVEQFMRANPSGQILSLGAGYDSLYWRLKSNNFLQSSGDLDQTQINYVEVDMSPVTLHKSIAIRKHPQLSNLLTNIRYKGDGLHSDRYHLISFDLRQVNKSSFLLNLTNDCNIDTKKATLCIVECVLVYMPIEDSSSLISWMSSNFSKMTILNYEQCNMADRFGDIMLAHMEARHCDLMGVEACKSLKTQIERFNFNGLPCTKAWTLMEIFCKCLSPSETDRIKQIEFLDERELLDQLLEHYCIIVASHEPLDWISEDEYWLARTL